jgi:hypothetical protein
MEEQQEEVEKGEQQGEMETWETNEETKTTREID